MVLIACFDHATWHGGSWFPDWDRTCTCPLHWKLSLNHWATRKIPVLVSSYGPFGYYSPLSARLMPDSPCLFWTSSLTPWPHPGLHTGLCIREHQGFRGSTDFRLGRQRCGGQLGERRAGRGVAGGKWEKERQETKLRRRGPTRSWNEEDTYEQDPLDGSLHILRAPRLVRPFSSSQPFCALSGIQLQNFVAVLLVQPKAGIPWAQKGKLSWEAENHEPKLSASSEFKIQIWRWDQGWDTMCIFSSVRKGLQWWERPVES